MEHVLRLENIEVRAAGRTLLAIDDLEVRAGETLAVVGPTGAGKSTLLRVMAGLEIPARGHSWWRGELVKAPWPLALRRRVAMAFQAPLLFRGTVLDNVAYGLRLRGERRDAIRRKAAEALRRFGIEDLATRPAHTLSGGEAQRVSLARAVVLRPELLLLDEPLASLDALTRERLQAELRDVVRGFGLSCVHVTHDQAEARALGDRIALLAAGRLLEVGPPEEPFYRPRTLAVARALGMQNLWPGRLAQESGKAAVMVGELRIAASGPVPPETYEEVVAAVRAEDIGLTREPPDGAGAAAGNVLPGTVTEHRTIGPMIEVTLDCGTPVVALVSRRVWADLETEPGRRLYASFPPDAVCLLAAQGDPSRTAG
ncbi:MAG: ABC transporter ATP-binding protein [Deltaproteobacteria bacterium]|nr:ABC transporter ATP-binding protein [Deltaproteobacteria bacterium]